jgi:chromosome segregation ATPase
MFVGCASQPTQEIDAAKAAIEAATTEGANVYAADQLTALNDSLNAAIEEAKAQTGKLFKSNAEAKTKLAQIKSDAEALKATIPAKKEEAKNNAITVQTETKALVEEAKTLVASAPTAKDSQADIEAFKADLTALDEALLEVQKGIDAQDYIGATEKCKSIKEKATNITDQIKQAIEKITAMQAAKPTKKKK